MITLLTKDGTKTGNAIIYGGDDFVNVYSPKVILDLEPGTPMKPIFFVETDFGNRMKLTWSEIEELFTVGRVCPYDQWKADRNSLREQNAIHDTPLDYGNISDGVAQ